MGPKFDNRVVDNLVWLSDLGISMQEHRGNDFDDDQEPKNIPGYTTAVMSEDIDRLYHCLWSNNIALANKVGILYGFLTKAERSKELGDYLTIPVCVDLLQIIGTRTTAPVYWDESRLHKIKDAALDLTKEPIKKEWRYAYFHELFTNLYPDIDSTRQSPDPRD